MATYRPTQAAKALGVSVSTIRNWANDFGEFLSEHASPAPGESRYFDDHDMAVLRAIADFRQQGLETAQVAEKLSQTSIPTIEPAETQEHPIFPVSQASVRFDLSPVADVLRELGDKLDRIADTQQDVREMDRRLRRLERFSATQTAIIIILAVALIVALVLLAVAYMA